MVQCYVKREKVRARPSRAELCEPSVGGNVNASAYSACTLFVLQMVLNNPVPPSSTPSVPERGGQVETGNGLDPMQELRTQRCYLRVRPTLTADLRLTETNGDPT
jgi:hypothetical protein